MKEIILLLTIGILSIVDILPAQNRTDITPDILPMRDRAEVMDRWTENRLDTLVPELMHREGIDMWVLVAREYNEDPVLLTMLPATWQSSRRTTILVFYDPGDGRELERFAVSRYDIGFFETEWFPDEEPDQWKRFGELVAERNPEMIGVNVSEHFALADGISYTDYNHLKESLTFELQERIVSAENLAIGWLETRTEEEMAVYRQINRIAHNIVAQGLSEKVITPGITTTEDLQWWYRERIRDLNLTTWFHPSVSIDRSESPEHTGDFSGPADTDVILPGDIVWMDLGIEYLGLTTDTQRNAYILRQGESEAPEGLRNALEKANRVQDILTSHFETGRTGNQILSSALRQAEEEGINTTIYTHPLGYHGHGAGSTIGLWDQQDGVPGWGDYPLYPNTAHSIELNAEVYVPEWDRTILMKLEENAIFDGDDVWYIDGRMQEFYLVPRQK
ncbi:aminopeptidase P family protein [Rhodohalobacter sp. SW132]|uniref:M24 family metallopeptidase n=1 Tax=Rhodohalobacter sp. SW132 TaxID=2293433 RepID=UPI000E26B9C3|nr:M24 family metallopeptidase [Rhodohalobacter sp. SW132]REL25004.1 aminopeptidase P family protein [Rhodohalobacter sp. SW132]